MLNFLIDPTKIPVQQRIYFRPEENLQNSTYENAKADALIAYKDQRSNSDFYPIKNRQLTKMEASLMDRKTLIASMDILSKNFKDTDPIGTDLRTMAAAVAKMSDEELSGRINAEAPNFDGMEVEAKAETFECPKCGTNVLKQTGYCVKCKSKVKAKSAAEESEEKEEVVEKDEKEVEASEVSDFWTKEATDLVARALVADVLGLVQAEEEEKEPKEEKEPAVKEEEKSAGKVKGPGISDGTGPMKDAPKCDKAEKVEAKKEPEVIEPEVKEPEEKLSTVDTDILASVTFGDSDVVLSSDELNMSDEEKNNLANLFN